jgi:hypothetical protein
VFISHPSCFSRRETIPADIPERDPSILFLTDNSPVLRRSSDMIGANRGVGGRPAQRNRPPEIAPAIMFHNTNRPTAGSPCALGAGA